MRSSSGWSGLLLAAVLAACGGAEPATQAPTLPPASTPEATAEPSTATGFAPDTLVSVIEGPLRVRSKPSVEEDSEKFTPLLDTGQRLFVISGPVQGSGYNWYLVRPVAKRVTSDGWVSAGSREGVPWLQPAAADCPPVPTLADIGALDPALRILCFAGRDLTFTTTITWGGNCGSGVLFDKPAWLASCETTFRWGGKTSTVIVAVPPELAGAVGSNKAGDTFKAKVTAHLDDPGGLTCQAKAGTPGDPVIVSSTVVLDCRAIFVTTAFERT